MFNNISRKKNKFNRLRLESLSSFNAYTFFKLPSAWWTGVRLTKVEDQLTEVSVKHRWVNQNPFGSMFWAVQGMAAELPTGLLVMKAIDDSKRKVSMLVTHQEADFYKKASGRITFSCTGGNEIRDAIQKSIETSEGQKIVLTAEGKNENGVVVSKFHFHWSIKVKS